MVLFSIIPFKIISGNQSPECFKCCISVIYFKTFSLLDELPMQVLFFKIKLTKTRNESVVCFAVLYPETSHLRYQVFSL